MHAACEVSFSSRAGEFVCIPGPSGSGKTTLLNLIAGLLLTVLLCSVAVSRAQVPTLRRYLGTLVAIGLTPGWARQVALVQSAFLAAVATGVALALAILPVVITAWRLEGFVLSIPWRVVGLVVAAFYLAVLLAALLSSRQIRASERAAL